MGKGLSVMDALLAVLLSTGAARAQVRAIEPEQAGPDFPVQGEYAGEAANGQPAWAAQVVAMGDGSFRAVFLAGGLPGAGYAGGGRIEAAGQRSGSAVALTGTGFQATADGIELHGTGPGGAALRLRKVMRASPTMGLKPPAGALVLFDGTGTAAWDTTAGIDGRGFLKVPSRTRQAFGTFSLHLEFRVPFEPSGRGQDRGNSGFCMPAGAWTELQVLDSFGDDPLLDGCGAVYNLAKARISAAFPPLSWQTYDVRYSAPVQGRDSSQPARVTAWLNGILVHDNVVLSNRAQSSYFLLQDHGHPVFYRNIWLVNGKADYDFLASTRLAIPVARPYRGFAGPARAREASLSLWGNRPGFLRAEGIFGPSGRWFGTEAAAGRADFPAGSGAISRCEPCAKGGSERE
jgi:hypothetical protein